MRDYLLLVQCPICGKVNEVAVNEKDYLAFQNGEPILDCFPYLNADERELLMTGICIDCWDKMFPEEEEEEFQEFEDLECGFDPYCGCYTFDC